MRNPWINAKIALKEFYTLYNAESLQNSLDGLVASEGSGYYYFSNHQVFWAWNDGGIFKKKIVGSYTGNTFYEGTGSYTVTITATNIILDNGVTMKIVSDSALIAKIKNASEV